MDDLKPSYKARLLQFLKKIWHKVHWHPYRPLIVLIAIVFLASIALQIEAVLSWIDGWFSKEDTGMTGAAILQNFMHAFMGLMFLQFGMFKLFDLDGFVKGFKKYDIFAQSSDTYAHSYPFIEIGLGFAYLSYFIPALTYAITMIVMAISAFSVLRAVRAGLDVQCACLGTVLNVPLSTVSLIENIGMGMMAALMLLAAIY